MSAVRNIIRYIMVANAFCQQHHRFYNSSKYYSNWYIGKQPKYVVHNSVATGEKALHSR